MNPSAPFIRRPVATTLLSLAVLLAGVWAFILLPVAPLPRVEFPTINVSATLPGASPETMAAAVAAPLERSFGRIAGLSELTSTSSIGTTSITLQFALDRNIDSAARDVQAAIATAAGDLPSNLPRRPTYRKVNPTDAPIMALSLTSATLPLSQVFEAANTVLAPKVSRISGVGQVYVAGGQQRALRVQADPRALAAGGLSLEDLRTAIARSTVDLPKGALTSGGQLRMILANDQLFDAESLRSLLVGPRGRAPIRLGEVANVIEGVENARVAAWTRGERSILVVIRCEPDANIIETTARIRTLLPELVGSISPAIALQVTLDRTSTIRSSVHDMVRALVLAVLLVMLVVFLFLRSARASAIPCAAILLSLVGTFAVMYVLGYGLDNLSLMALTLAVGFVVDDAIVVTENVTRHLELGHSPLEAALLGSRQTGFTILSMTLALIAVFIPLLLTGGIIGRLFREFAVTLSVAVLLSGIVSLTLIPMLCSRILRPSPPAARGLLGAAERGFDALQASYLRWFDRALRHRRVMQFIALATLAGSVALFILVPKGFLPQQDSGMLIGLSQGPGDISFAAMRSRQQALDRILLADPAVDEAVSFVGGGSTINTGNVFVGLKPRGVRQASSDDVIRRLRARLAEVAGISLYLQGAQDVRVGGRATRTQYQYTLLSMDVAELRDWTGRALAAFRRIPQLTDVVSDQQNAGLELGVELDRDTAARLGVSPLAVDNVLYDAYGQRQIATTFTALDQYRIVLEVTPELSQTPDALEHLYVASSDGAPIPLLGVASRRVGSAPLSVPHQGQFPSATLSFNLAPGTSLGQAVDAIRGVERELNLPSSVHASFSGTARAFRESSSNTPLLAIAALLSVYVVLGVLYESYAHPITILSTLPSAGLGALLALLLTSGELNVIAVIGILLLIGIVQKNAILVVDFALEAKREQHMSALEAIREGCRLRFRPILMTTIAALLGATPLAFGTGEGAELRRPLGLAIIGGLLVSQLITLFTTPVTYLMLERLSRRKGAKREPAGVGVTDFVR